MWKVNFVAAAIVVISTLILISADNVSIQRGVPSRRLKGFGKGKGYDSTTKFTKESKSEKSEKSKKTKKSKSKSIKCSLKSVKSEKSKSKKSKSPPPPPQSKSKKSKSKESKSKKSKKTKVPETLSPQCSPTTRLPTKSPTEIPSAAPSESPSTSPSHLPTKSPSKTPNTDPTKSPTKNPSPFPSFPPTDDPTSQPIACPVCPTLPPTINPTAGPSEKPSTSPTKSPTEEYVRDLRIMPLGDSITKGFDTPGGYRLPLFFELESSGYNINFLGTMSDKVKIDNGVVVFPPPGFDTDNEGHGGKTIQFFTDNIDTWFTEIVESPDIILLNVGTNDFNGAPDTSELMKTAIVRLDILIKKIANFRPMSHIIATTLIKKKEPENNEINRLFNPYVEDIVNNNAADGVRISFYDMYPVVPFDELIDGIHPSKVGYGLMADAWLEAIQALQNDRPPELTGAIAYIGSNIVTLVLSTAITDSSLNDISNFGISNGIVVEGATLRKDKRQIDLQTSDFSQYVGTTLNAVIVGGVRGRAFPGFSMTPFNVVTFEIVASLAPTLAPVPNTLNGKQNFFATKMTGLPTIGRSSGILPTSKVKIMPFGGSLTVGQSNYPGGYRKNLFSNLKADGYNVEFVGTKRSNFITGIDALHSGIPDKYVNFYTNFAEKLLDNIYPDIILLHVGTYDFEMGYNMETCYLRYDLLIKELARIRPFSQIIATNLLLRNDPENTAIQTYFNPKIENIVDTNAEEGIRVSYLDIRSYVQQDQLNDGVYPNQDGYNNMARGFASAIKEISEPDGDNYYPEIMSHTTNSMNEIILTFSKPISDESANTDNFSINQDIIVSTASLDQEKRAITLTVSDYSNITESITVTFNQNGINDRTRSKLSLKNNQLTIFL